MYSLKFKDESKVAKARVEGVDASYKDLVAVCDNIRRRRTDIALELLEKVSKGLTPIRYYTHNTKMGHRHELGGQKGRYPRKAAGIVLKLLNSVIANARSKNLTENRLVVCHAAANRKEIFRRLQPKGLRKRHDHETARVELAVTEIVKKSKPAKEKGTEKPVAKEAKKPVVAETKQ